MRSSRLNAAGGNPHEPPKSSGTGPSDRHVRRRPSEPEPLCGLLDGDGGLLLRVGIGSRRDLVEDIEKLSIPDGVRNCLGWTWPRSHLKKLIGDTPFALAPSRTLTRCCSLISRRRAGRGVVTADFVTSG